MTRGLEEVGPLKGAALIVAGIILAFGNFVVVLDVTIANVSVAHIAGSLGITPSQGTWIITSYAVAEAVCVPLTGWLANRFGAVRTFIVGMIGFGVFSVLCGLSSTLGMLIAFRIGQGLCAGPIMPLSQMLLLRIFPEDKKGQAIGIWATTSTVAPILGPILGGVISESLSWHWIFFINVPVVILCAGGGLRLLGRVETPTSRVRVDSIGLGLLVLWIASLQIILDIGREHEWFADTMIVTLGVIAAIGFALFLAWELTARDPVVDLRVFRHRGFTAAVASLSIAYATVFSAIVLIPQWLQINLGYTSTSAGYVTGLTGLGAVVMAPIAGKLDGIVDSRKLVTFGILWLALTALLRTQWTSAADFWALSFPLLLQGIGMPFFFISLTTIALGAVEPEETASAAGVMGFLRTMAGAIGTSLAITMWNDSAVVSRNEIVSNLNSDATVQTLAEAGMSLDLARGLIERTVQQESMTLALNHMSMLSGIALAVAAAAVWLAPRPQRVVAPGGAH